MQAHTYLASALRIRTDCSPIASSPIYLYFPNLISAPNGHIETKEGLFSIFKNDTSIDPKQQQTMFPRLSCTIKNSLGAPFLRKETKEKKVDKPGTGARNQKETEKHDGRQSSSWEGKEKKSREANPGTLAGTRRKKEIMMQHNATTLGRQAPQPFLEPDGTRR